MKILIDNNKFTTTTMSNSGPIITKETLSLLTEKIDQYNCLINTISIKNSLSCTSSKYSTYSKEKHDLHELIKVLATSNMPYLRSLIILDSTLSTTSQQKLSKLVDKSIRLEEIKISGLKKWCKPDIVRHELKKAVIDARNNDTPVLIAPDDDLGINLNLYRIDTPKQSAFIKYQKIIKNSYSKQNYTKKAEKKKAEKIILYDLNSQKNDLKDIESIINTAKNNMSDGITALSKKGNIDEVSKFFKTASNKSIIYNIVALLKKGCNIDVARKFFKINDSGIKQVVKTYINDPSIDTAEVSKSVMDILFKPIGTHTNQFDFARDIYALGDNGLNSIIEDYFCLNDILGSPTINVDL
jgi:hypothetical protein